MHFKPATRQKDAQTTKQTLIKKFSIQKYLFFTTKTNIEPE